MRWALTLLSLLVLGLAALVIHWGWALWRWWGR